VLRAALDAEGGVQARAARRLGISKSNLSYRLQRLGIVRLGVVYGEEQTGSSARREAQTEPSAPSDEPVDEG
jgi:hypothetical protein